MHVTIKSYYTILQRTLGTQSGPLNIRDYLPNPTSTASVNCTLCLLKTCSVSSFFGCSFVFQVTGQSLRRFFNTFALKLESRQKWPAFSFLQCCICYSSGTVFCANTVFQFLSGALSSAHDLLFLSAGRKRKALDICLFQMSTVILSLVF